jgi:hypothetical protein
MAQRLQADLCDGRHAAAAAVLCANVVPYRYAPNFGYSAAAVGMSDRVESTVHKVGPS